MDARKDYSLNYSAGASPLRREAFADAGEQETSETRHTGSFVIARPFSRQSTRGTQQDGNFTCPAPGKRRRR